MKAIIYEKYGPPEVLKTIETQKPIPNSNELLVKVRAIALNPLDYRIRRGWIRPLTDFNFPRLIGSDFSGEIVEVGEKVTSFNKGDRVYGMSFQLISGTSADYIKVKPHVLSVIPDKLTFEEAAAVPLAAQTSLQALRDLGNLEKSGRVLINGASGGVGVFALGIAKIIGAHITAVTSFRNIDFVKGLGADKIIDYTKEDFTKAGQKYDIIFDCWGNKNFLKVKDSLEEKGIYISTIPNVKNYLLSLNNIINQKKGKVILVKSRSEDLKTLKDYIDKGSLKVIVDKVFSKSEIIEAYKYLETKRAKGKVVVSFE
ncbi:MAG: NAD(P)-dependent alcohol dehydrogenase [Bdellovibrionota bacterium]|nr:NAD(P)-dependent alcohol dehydrogenase [Bdellovibrionota bacterium]